MRTIFFFFALAMSMIFVSFLKCVGFILTNSGYKYYFVL